MRKLRFLKTHAMTRLVAGATFFCLALLAGIATATSHSTQQPSGKAMIRSPMQLEMLQIEQKTKQLHIQMQEIRNTADYSERYRLLLAHLKSMREALNDVSSMELKMIDDVNRGRMVSDSTLKHRQAIMRSIMDMMQIMLEQIALFQEPALR